MATHSQWYVIPSPLPSHDSRVSSLSPPPLLSPLAWRQKPSLGGPSLLVFFAFPSTGAHYRRGSMSRDSPPSSPQAPRASPTGADKEDAYDANIRNFAPVARIMKNALPENAKIAKEAKECMQECVSEFISFITSEGKHSRLRE